VIATRAQPGTLALASAGIGVIGASFGMARYGYGLLLPDIRAAYGLSTSVLGVIAAGSYLSYLVASAAAAALAARLGPRRMVVLGGACAAGGMLLAGLSQGPLLLALGILVGGASCGLVFPPFSDAVALLPAAARGRALAAISSGTGYGVAVAGPVAVLAGSAWRTAWLVFAAIAVAVTAWAARVLPAGTVGGAAAGELPRLRWRWFVCPRSGPLLLGALLVGIGASAFWTFGVDYLVGEGTLAPAQGRLFLAAVGLASVLGTLAGDMVRRLGATAAFASVSLALGLSVCLLAVAPLAPAAAAVSAVLFGAAYNLIVAIEVIWSTRVFASRPSAGLAGVMFMSGLGLLAGPLVAGPPAEALGLGPVLGLAGALLALTALLAPRERLAPAPAARGG
jgi:predicted MFS family arabinose efflux permease